MAFDTYLFRLLNSLVGIRGWIDTWIIFKSEFLGWWILIALLVGIVFAHEKKREIGILVQACIAGLVSRFIFAEIIQYWYDRPRPFEVLDDIRQLVFHASGGSFPSAHASFFFAIAAVVFFYKRVWGVIFFGMALYMGTGRVEAGLHWPSDIVAGAVIGIFSAWIVRMFIKKLKA